MVSIKEVKIDGYQKVIEATDPASKLHCIIAIHSTTLGPALGGIRIYPYASTQDAYKDVLGLSKSMTYKSSVAQLGIGGGKSVIIADPRLHKNEALLLAFAEVVDSLKGDYIAAEDVGTCTRDLAIIQQKTPYVAALDSNSSSGDPSRFTARGVFRGIQATAQKLWGSPSLTGKKVLIQGLGSVGSKLAELLFWEGAELILSEIDPRKLQEQAHQLGAKTIGINEAPLTECDIYVPCALSGIITEQNAPLLRCRAIAGAANTQLATPVVGEILLKRGILYAPDYVINAGGLINATAEFNDGGYDAVLSRNKVDNIYDTLLQIYDRSEKEHLPTGIVANELAEHNLKNRIGQRKTPINFKQESQVTCKK